jgi:hypothetical protein
MRVNRVRFYVAEMTAYHPFTSLHDLLRYDVAFVKSVDDRPESEVESERKRIIIACPLFMTKAGSLGAKSPTTDRWQSHGVPLRESSREELQTLACSTEAFVANHDGWVTYRHPRNADGAQVYGGGLVPVSLAVFTDPKRKDTRDL